jgi:hypothetical protein
LLGDYTRTIAPARALAADTLTLERTLSDLVNQAYALTPAEIELMWRIARPACPSCQLDPRTGRWMSVARLRGDHWQRSIHCGG